MENAGMSLTITIAILVLSIIIGGITFVHMQTRAARQEKVEAERSELEGGGNA